MASKKKFINTKYGYGTIGVDVFFSVSDVHRFRNIIADIQRDDEAKEIAIRDLMYLHDRIASAFNSEEDSLFNPQTDEEENEL